VTGGTTEIESTVAGGLADAGAEVAICAPTAEGLKKAFETLAQIDVLVHTARGCPFNRPYIGISHDGLAEVAEQCVRSVAGVCEEAGPHLAQNQPSSVIIINAHQTLRPWPELTAGVMKSLQLELVKLLAQKWAADGVRINAISQRPDSLDGVTDVVLWLASDAARHVTGTHIPLDGGENVSVSEEWRQLLNDLLREHGEHSYASRERHLASISALRMVDSGVDRVG
jgi:enoyl-[acyl-carrier-protein] reductase (NADH)